MRVAALFNPNAGKRDLFFNVGEIISTVFAFHDIYVLYNKHGSAYLKTANNVYVSSIESKDYITTLNHHIRTLTECKPDLFICIGGDGLSTNVANYLIRNEINIPILGVAGGTANVGPIVQYSLEDLKNLDVDNLKLEYLDGLKVSSQNEFLSFAFNDMILANTYLGTTETSTMVNLSVKELLENGESVITEPEEKILDEGYHIKLNNEVVLEESDNNIAQIIGTSIKKESHYGRALYGPLCSAPYSNKYGVLALSDFIVVTSKPSPKGLNTFSQMKYLLFGEEDKIEISGINESIYVICDGNPYPINNQTVEINYISNIIQVVQKR